jgi:thiosulfate/3-mercaptopyruvate sulfurtransferase
MLGANRCMHNVGTPATTRRIDRGGEPMSEAAAPPLVETDWLQSHLDDPAIRVLDCTVHLRPAEGGGVRPESGREDWARSHVPGSGFADLINDLCDPDSRLPLMMPTPERFADAMGRYGVGEGTHAVLYDSGNGAWAARVWWMLRAFGFDSASVLNGGWQKWTAENRPVSDAAPQHPPARFVPRPRPQLIAGRDRVLAAVRDGGACVINALSPEEHSGEVARLPRPGRIAGSVNVPVQSLIDPATNAFLPQDQLRAAFERVGALDGRPIITYCGGGIAASGDAFVLAMLGVKDVALYDGSLSEWTADPELPMETG